MPLDATRAADSAAPLAAASEPPLASSAAAAAAAAAALVLRAVAADTVPAIMLSVVTVEAMVTTKEPAREGLRGVVGPPDPDAGAADAPAASAAGVAEMDRGAVL
jgi:hypothetical protein